MKPQTLIVILSALIVGQGASWAQKATSTRGQGSSESAARDLALNIHLMHPGGDSSPGDPNAAFCIDGTYHLHYILRHQFNGEDSFSFVHVTSDDMLHWQWQPTKLQPSFTGHGMFSGTGFVTKDGLPAVIYHGKDSGRNQIAIAKDRQLSEWNQPFPVQPMTTAGDPAEMRHWDPDCFRVDETYYAISGGTDPQLMKSADLKNWTHVGDFLASSLPNVAIGEDLSCANFFPLGDRWVLLCISHPLGCRYYIGDWDRDTEQFVPERHVRMNWRRRDQPIDEMAWDFFAPESVLTGDGRRVMWSWLARPNRQLRTRTIQSLPREISLGEDGNLRIEPIRELKSLRVETETITNLTVAASAQPFGITERTKVAKLDDQAYEICATISREQAARKRFGFRLHASDTQPGLPILIQPEYGTIRVGQSEAPFAVADLPIDEDVQLRIFVDRYLVEVFINGRQALYAANMDWQSGHDLYATTFGADTTFDKIQIHRLRPCNEGFLAALDQPVWQPETGNSQAARAGATKKSGARQVAEMPNATSEPQPTQTSARTDRPNIVIIYVDDLGNGDIQPFSDRFETPNLRAMADQGRVFSNFYVASSVCTPSRAALMTGCYPARIDMLHNDLAMDTRNHGVLWPGDRKGLNPDETTIAELLKDRGYTTACIGKWHLGDQVEFMPTRQGFDQYFGIPFSNDMGNVPPFDVPLPLVRNESVVQELSLEDQNDLTLRYTREAIEFIEKQSDSPFFLYLSHAMVHKPHVASEAFAGKTGLGIYADAVAEVDWSTGQILDKLRALNLHRNTLVIFTSDNGAPWGLKADVQRYASNAPYSGGKATAAEGGFRVPMIAWWPGRITAGSECKSMASTIDLAPTLASLAGRPYVAPDNKPIDGVDIGSLLSREIPGTSPRDSFVYYSDNTDGGPKQPRRLSAVRQGRWKYYLHPQRFRLVDGKRIANVQSGALFNLNTDPAETTDVSASHTRVVAQLQDFADHIVAEFGDPAGSGPAVRRAGMVDQARPINAARP
tara:strand:- start:384020 stop:387067 length:3048 start_codon:yes stop_codon:yes gene_type:complete